MPNSSNDLRRTFSVLKLEQHPLARRNPLGGEGSGIAGGRVFGAKRALLPALAILG